MTKDEMNTLTDYELNLVSDIVRMFDPDDHGLNEECMLELSALKRKFEDEDL